MSTSRAPVCSACISPYAVTNPTYNPSSARAAGGQTPLHLACELNAASCVSALLANGADVRAEDGQLRTPLLLACESNAVASAKALVEAGASLASSDKGDMTPLHWLAHHGAEELLRLALHHGAEIDAVDFMMRSPLW